MDEGVEMDYYSSQISRLIEQLSGLPGIGPKSAKRIILELKDKIKTEQQVEALKNQIKNQEKTNEKIQKAIQKDAKVEEATAALQVLGYNRKEIEKAFNKLEKTDLTVEELIKKGLNILGV